MRLKLIFLFMLALLVIQSHAQSFILGGDASFTMGDSTSLFLGGDASINGIITNSGTIISYSNIDLMDNTTMDSVSFRFVGSNDQTLKANDSLVVNDLSMEMDTEFELNLDVEVVIVEGILEITSGVLGAGADTTLLASGEITGGSDDGFIEGKVVSLTQSDIVDFPLGVNGFYNSISLSNLPLNTVIVVESSVPDPDRLKPTEDMVGIADEVEWIITTPGDSIEVRASAIFNGIDLNDLSNGEFIRAQKYSPVLVKYGASDTLYQDLGVLTLEDTDNATFGYIEGEKSFYISSTPTYLSIALIPVLEDPVFFVPDVFSPNSTRDENRVFKPYFAGAEVIALKINVIDSYQNRLYYYDELGEDIDFDLLGWDGRLPNGEVADAGVYYYTIELQAGGESYSDFGSFLLSN